MNLGPRSSGFYQGCLQVCLQVCLFAIGGVVVMAGMFEMAAQDQREAKGHIAVGLVLMGVAVV